MAVRMTIESIEVLEIGSSREIRGIRAYVAPLKRLTPASKGGPETGPQDNRPEG